MKFTYTFPSDYPTVELRGVTATDGVFGKASQGDKLANALLFSVVLNGEKKTVPLFVDDHPDLAALLEQENAIKDASSARKHTDALATVAGVLISLVAGNS